MAIGRLNTEAEAADGDADKLGKISRYQKEAGKRAKQLRTRRGRDATLDFASSILATTGDQWDNGAALVGMLPTPTGIVDMATGQLRPGLPQDMVKTVIPHEWQPDAKCPRFVQFIDEIMGGDIVLQAFLQRLFGYSASGSAKEHKLPILWGVGRNGKDTLLEAGGFALGPLAGTVTPDVVLDPGGQRSAGAATPHLMALRGKRLVWVNEPNDGQYLNVAQVKALTGGGRRRGRELYQGEVEWDATEAICLLTNHIPQADPDDYALWQRLLLIPFTQVFVPNPGPGEHKADPNLLVTLREEAPGILAWLVRGYQMYLEDGLSPPETVTKATKESRKDQDRIGAFIKDCCWVKETLKESGLKGIVLEARGGFIYKIYQDWAKDQGMIPLGNNKFSEKLLKREGIRKDRDNKGVIYFGIGVKAELGTGVGDEVQN
jgi:putative DNA primase/helicase